MKKQYIVFKANKTEILMYHIFDTKAQALADRKKLQDKGITGVMLKTRRDTPMTGYYSEKM